jgi:hypothetical protein
MHTIFFEDLNRRFADIGRLIIDQTAPKERNLPRRGGRNLCRPSAHPPMDKRLSRKSQDLSIPMYAGPRFYHPTKKPEAHDPIGHSRQQTSEGADHIRLDQQSIAPAHPSRHGQMLLPRDHQAGEIESVLMRRRIGAMVETEFTVIAFIDDPMVVGWCELGDVTLIPVNAVEQRVERRTKIEAAPTAIADFIDALRVFLELRGIDGIDQA